SLFYVGEQGSQDRAVGRGEGEQIDATTPLSPLDLYACRGLRVHIHHHRPNLARPAACVIDCSNDRFIDAVDGNHDDVASWKWRTVITRERDLFRNRLVMRA